MTHNIFDDFPDPTSLPRFSAWKEGWSLPVDLSDYLCHEGNLEFALALCQYFWPRVIVMGGCYLRAEGAYLDEDSPHKTLEEQQAHESLVNHLHIYDLFSTNIPNTPLEAYEYVAKVMLKTWEAALNAQYPDVLFAFDYQTEPDAYGPTISFWHL